MRRYTLETDNGDFIIIEPAFGVTWYTKTHIHRLSVEQFITLIERFNSVRLSKMANRSDGQLGLCGQNYSEAGAYI